MAIENPFSIYTWNFARGEQPFDVTSFPGGVYRRQDDDHHDAACTLTNRPSYIVTLSRKAKRISHSSGFREIALCYTGNFAIQGTCDEGNNEEQ